MNKDKGFYLAHPIVNRKELKEWQDKIEKEYDIEINNPFYKVYRREIDLIDQGKAAIYSGNHEDIVNSDTKMIRNSIGIIAFVTGAVSYGTIMEIVYAHIFGKIIYIICLNGHENHPWFKYHATAIFTSTEDFEKTLKKKQEVKHEAS